MTIEKLPSGSYRIKKMIDGKRYSVTVDHKPSKAEAERIMEEITKDRFTMSNKSMTYAEAAEGYFKLKSNVLSPTTTKAYKSYLKNLPDAFTRMQIDKIDQLTVQKLINEITPNYSSKSVQNIHGFISAVLGIYRPNFKLHTHLPPKTKFEPRTPTNANVDQIVQANKGTKYEVPFRLACYGLRRSEICALTADDLKGNYININKAYVHDGEKWITRPFNKTYGSTRKVYIDDELAELISRIDGKIWKNHPNTLRKRLLSLLKKYEIPQFRLHDFRAFFVSYAHALGIPDAYIMAQGGWSSPTVMQRVYRRTLEDQQQEAMQEYAKHLPK